MHIARPSQPAHTPRQRANASDKLWRDYARAPGNETRNRLIEHYQPLVAEIVRRFFARLPRLVDRGDLDTAANFGLIDAIEGFDRARGVRFEIYCERRIRGAVLDELRNQDWLSRPFRGRIEQLRRVREELRSGLGREPSEAEVAQALGPDEARRGFALGMSASYANPVLSGQSRKGDNLWTASIVAVNPDTGKMAWYYQATPHDTHDWDAAQTPILIDGVVDGKPRKLIAQANRNGHFFLIDRTNGKHILTAPFIDSLNWTK